MVNFVEAYNSGLKAAKKARKSKEEIDLIFKELQKQILEATAGTISVTRKKLPDPPKSGTTATPNERRLGLISGANSIFRQLQEVNSQSDEKTNYHLAIAAENPSKKNSVKEIAKWSQDRAGYPCKIFLDSETIYCADGRGLENALTKLLSDPGVGEILYKLQNLSMPDKVSIETPADLANLDASNQSVTEI